MKRKRMSERRLEKKLGRLLERVMDNSRGHDLSIDRVDKFRERGVLTNNRGLVVTLGNGQEFQLTIVESTR
jgi:hypothetical protein